MRINCDLRLCFLPRSATFVLKRAQMRYGVGGQQTPADAIMQRAMSVYIIFVNKMLFTGTICKWRWIMCQATSTIMFGVWILYFNLLLCTPVRRLTGCYWAQLFDACNQSQLINLLVRLDFVLLVHWFFEWSLADHKPSTRVFVLRLDKINLAISLCDRWFTIVLLIGNN